MKTTTTMWKKKKIILSDIIKSHIFKVFSCRCDFFYQGGASYTLCKVGRKQASSVNAIDTVCYSHGSHHVSLNIQMNKVGTLLIV